MLLISPGYYRTEWHMSDLLTMKYDDDGRGCNFIKEPQVSSRCYKGFDEPRFYVAQIYLRKGKLRILVILYANEFQLRVSRGINPVVSIHSEKPVGLICRFIEERVDLLSVTHTRTSKSKHTTRWSIRGEKRERKRVGCANGQVYRDLARRLLLRTNYFLIVNISTINDFS